MVDKIWYNMEELIGDSEERGINRNIVECKGKASGSFNIPSLCINRNIVECKAHYHHRNTHLYFVLIET